MKILNLLFLALLGIFLAGCNLNKDEQTIKYIPSDSVLKSFENQMAAFCSDLNITNLSYAIVNDSKIIQSKFIGLQNEQQNIIDDNTIYPIGNMADVMASILILQQTEAGKVDLKDRLAEYGVDNPGINKATVKQILSYTYLDKPGTSFTYDTKRCDIMKKVVESVSNDYFSNQMEKEIIDELDMEHSSIGENGSMKSSVSDLAKFSIALDNKVLFDDTTTTELMYRPVFLSNGEKTPSALGWLVHFCYDKKFIWSFGQGDDYSSLIIKSLSDSLTFIVLANSANLNKPFNLQDGNFTKSPVAIAFLKTFIFRNDTFPDFKTNQSDSLTKRAFENIKISKYKNLLINELISNIYMYQYMDKDIEKDNLISMYNRYLPNDVPWALLEKKPRAIIDNVGDYENLIRTFHIDNDTNINIYAVGEFVRELVMNPWEYDNVEMYIDIHNNKKSSFDNRVHRHYRFTYDYPEMTGNYTTCENIKFVQSDLSNTKYIFEINIPWNTLDSIVPKPGTRIGFDISAGDNDGNVRETCINWIFEKQQKPWENPSLYGTLLLNETQKTVSGDSICNSLRCNSPIMIDGKIDQEWNRAKSYNFTKTTSDFMPDKKDFSGFFKTMWDDQNLYFMIEITDDFKKLLPLSADYGWIENSKGDTIWKMTKNNSLHAGGTITNRFVNTTVKLVKGDYTLNYSSNQSNSTVRWTNKQPDMNFYGIAVY